MTWLDSTDVRCWRCNSPSALTLVNGKLQCRNPDDCDDRVEHINDRWRDLVLADESPGLADAIERVLSRFAPSQVDTE